jgi:hypothetical protein
VREQQHEVPSAVVTRIGRVCRRLPEVVEEPAWVGTRWRVRGRTFGHVLVVESGRPPAYARAAATDGPATVLMFRASGPELEALRHAGPPFFVPRWRSDEVGLILGADPDWEEIAELLTESYCVQAPRSLRDRVDRPQDGSEGSDDPPAGITDE